MTKKPETHPLVKAISDGSGKPGDATPVVGYIGPSEKPGHSRIYNNLSLQNYLEVPDHAIEKVAPLDDTNENSPSLALVKSGTKVQSTVTRQHPVEAGFLHGVVTGSYLNDIEGGRDRSRIRHGHTISW